MNTAETNLRETFARQFEPWHITLPEEPLRDGLRGQIRDQGWTITYRVCAQDGDLWLETFSTHRMTNDVMRRITSQGKVELLGYCQEAYLSGDSNDREKLIAHNRAFYAAVRAAGLEPDG